MVKLLRYYNCIFHNHSLRRVNYIQTDLTILHTRQHFTTLSSIIGHPFGGINLLQVGYKLEKMFIRLYNNFEPRIFDAQT